MGAAPRLAPIPREDWADDGRAALSTAYSEAVAARSFSDGPDAIPAPTVLATLMHHPALAGPFLAYSNMLLQRPALEPRLPRAHGPAGRVAHRRALRVGTARPARGARRDHRGRDRGRRRWCRRGEWPPLEADLLAATDQLIDDYRVNDETWARLAEQLDEAQLVEVVFVVGTYTGLAMAFNSFGLQLDPELQDIASASLPHFDD